MKLLCSECGYIEKALYDGYGFGDRLLEGVMFEVEVSGDRLSTGGVEEVSATYFSDLNTKKWLEAADESLQDVLEEHGEGLNCTEGNDHEVRVVNDNGSPLGDVEPAKSTKIKLFTTKAVTLKEFLGEDNV